MRLWLLAATLLSTAVNASALSDGGLEVTAQIQQDKGRDDYLDGRLQEFVETKQNGRDYDSAQVEGYNSPLADQMDEFAGMEQESDDGSDKEENMADLEQDSEEGGTDQDLSDKQQNGDSYNEAELEQDEVGNDGNSKLDSFPQQMDDGGEEKLDSLLQQTGDGEDGGNMEQDAINQQIGDNGDEELSNIQQNDGDSYAEVELQQDEEGIGGEMYSLLQQMNDGGDEEKFDSLLQQVGDGDDENSRKLYAVGQQMTDDGEEENEQLEALLQQMEDGGGRKEDKLDSLFQQDLVGDREDGGNKKLDVLNQQNGEDSDENSEKLEALLQQIENGEGNSEALNVLTQQAQTDSNRVSGKLDTPIQQLEDSKEQDDTHLQGAEASQDEDGRKIDTLLQQLGNGEVEDDGKLEALLQQMEDDDKNLNLLLQQTEGDDDIEAKESNEATKDDEEEAILAQCGGIERDLAVAQKKNPCKGRVVCPAGYGLYIANSVYNTRSKDRIFKWRCKRIYSLVQIRADLRPILLRIQVQYKRTYKKLYTRYLKSRRYVYRYRRRRVRCRRKRYRRRRKCYRKYRYRVVTYSRNWRKKLINARRKYRIRVRSVRHFYYSRRYLRHTKCSKRKINNWNSLLSYNCPAESYLTGLYSYYNGKKQDRIWHATCCSVPGVCNKKCRWTDYVNGWRGRMSYRTGGVFAGLSSKHNNCPCLGDRRWKLRYCYTKKC